MAIGLANKPNVDAPGGDYPYGNIKDNTGAGNGTPVNKLVYADFHQFFERMLAIAGVVANGLPDNNTNGFQYFTALQNVIQSYIDTLRGGVPAAGDTLNKLYALITAMGRYRGGFDASSGAVPGPAADNEAGDFWRITVAGTIGTMVLKPGDVLVADIDDASAAANFYAIQANVDQATNSVLGLVKLYTDLAASNADGSVTQAAIKAAVDAKAPLDNPALTGIPTAPTAAPGTNTTQISNTAFVAAAVALINASIADKVAKAGDTMTGILEAQAGIKTRAAGQVLLWDRFPIGEWDMDTNDQVLVTHNISADKIAFIKGVIFRDDLGQRYDLNYIDMVTTPGTIGGGVQDFTSTLVRLRRTTGGPFDAVSFNATAAAPESLGAGANRGYITIFYIP